ncbi:unnamed protein product [Chrysoparadoxa australica]
MLSEEQHLKAVQLYGSDDALALTHDYFAALQGNALAQASLGYRHFYGYGTSQSCEAALPYYESAAKQVIDTLHEVGVLPMVERMRLSDVSSQGKLQVDNDHEVVSYYKHTARSGDLAAMKTLGSLYYHGQRGVQQDLAKAAEYFRRTADGGDTSAAGSYGEMLQKGLGVERDYDQALLYLRQGGNESHALSGMANAYLKGLGVKKDLQRAASLYEAATKSRVNPDALFHLGLLAMGEDGSGQGQGKGQVASRQKELPAKHDANKAFPLFSSAAQHGHVEALFRVGQMYSRGEGIAQSCQVALLNFKNVVERGAWSEGLANAQRLYHAGDKSAALWEYTQLAEAGYEVAQSNAAWLLEHGECGQMSKLECEAAALRMYQHSAKQGWAQSSLKVGDFHYYGMGGLEVDYVKAAQQYHEASEGREGKLPQAMFNLGLMYQHGQGLKQDFHLAKRYYDLAAETSMDSRVPVKLAMWSMKLQQMEWEMKWDLPAKQDSALILLVLSFFAVLLRLFRVRSARLLPGIL